MSKAFNPSQLLAQAASIGNVLKAAGAHDWTAEAIEAHKRAELAKAPPANFWWKWNETLGGLLPVALSAQAFLAMAPSLFLPQDTNPVLVLFLGGWQLASLVLFVWGVFFATARGPAQWNPYALLSNKSYRSVQRGLFEDIPPAARELVERIQSFNPHIGFKVEVLEQEKYHLDPVLYAVVKDKETPIFVWDADGNTVPPPV